jgi:TfoX/Sxy family transcriptional regulator of competence genes
MTFMVYDNNLAARVRERLAGTKGVTELKMFGGWGATVHGNMAVGVIGDDLIVRVGADRYAGELAEPGARPFDFTGREMTGWLYVDGTKLSNGRSLTRWVDLGVAYAASLPRKQPRVRKAAPATRKHS